MYQSYKTCKVVKIAELLIFFLINTLICSDLFKEGFVNLSPEVHSVYGIYLHNVPAAARVNNQLMGHAAAAAQPGFALCHMGVEVLIHPAPLPGSKVECRFKNVLSSYNTNKSNTTVTELREGQTHSTPQHVRMAV